MNPSAQRMAEEHRWAAQALPWKINGSMGEADAARLAEHMLRCAECRRDLEIEQGLALRMAAAPVADVAPQASLARMMQRLDQAPRARAAWWRRASRHWNDATRAKAKGRSGFALAFAMQAAALAGLGVTVGYLVQRPAPSQEYRTLSTASPVAAQLQLVFDEAATTQDMREILDKIGGRIVGGPSRAGVFLVSLQGGDSSGVSLQQDVSAAVAVLGAEPAVRYVAPLPAAATP